MEGLFFGVQIFLHGQVWRCHCLSVVVIVTNSIEGGGLWKRTPPPENPGPALYKTSFSIKSQPEDTFADMTVTFDHCSVEQSCLSHLVGLE